jgi:hypothetical protein
MPVVFMFAALAAILYYRESQNPSDEFSQFRDPEEMPTEPQIPAELPAGVNPLIVACVNKFNTQLDKSLWADVYYGMEARIDGKAITVKVTEKWQELSDDKRQTIANLVVDTWIENGRALKFLTSGDELEEIVIKRLPDDKTVAAWKPLTGVQLFKPEAGA